MNYNRLLSNFNFITYPILAALFLWSFGIPVGNVVIPMFIILVYLFLFILSVVKPQILFNSFVRVIKYTPFKYMILFVLWSILSFALFGHQPSKILYVIYRVFRDYILFIIPTILTAVLIIPRMISYKKMLKIFFIIFFLITSYGLIKFCVSMFSPNLHLILHTIFTVGVCPSDQLGRASSVFFEPSFYATFLFTTLPIVLIIAKSKYVIINRKISSFLKTMLVILYYLNLIATQSPMYIVASLAYTVFFFRKQLLGFITKYFYIVVLIFIFLCFLTVNVILPSDNKVVSRIENTVVSLKSVDEIINAEPSLGTRLSLIINTVEISKKHPIIGFGYTNTKEAMYKQLWDSDVPLTYEVIRSNHELGGLTVSNIFFQHISWVGIPGMILLYLFFVFSILKVRKCVNFYYGSERCFIEGIYLTSINYLICSFYWLLIADTALWFTFGILLSIILDSRNRKILILFLNTKKEVA